MADRCAGCTNKFKRFEKLQVCPECHRNFCSICIPRAKKGKKYPQPLRETCVYCARNQKDLNRVEEAEILENFQERFYKRAHHEPPIQTRVQLDYQKMHPDKDSSAAVPRLSEEDLKLEERLKKLKESRKPVKTAYSEDEIRQKLAKLRESESGHFAKNENQPSTSEDQGQSKGSSSETTQGSGKTQIEQAQHLLEQASDEVKLDERLAESNERRDEDLYNRFQVLKGKEVDPSKQSHFAEPKRSDSDIQKFLDNMEVQITDEEDPEKLLEDLRVFQAKEEKSALAEAQSNEICAMIGRTPNSEKQEDETTEPGQSADSDIPYLTPYPILQDLDSNAFESGAIMENVNKGDVVKLIEDAAEEIRQDELQELKTQSFIEEASERLVSLRSNSDVKADSGKRESETVSSKVTPEDAHKLDFLWSHFGASPRNPSSDLLASRQLGITYSGDFSSNSTDDSEEVQSLVDKMIAEAALDSKLEESGYNLCLDTTPQASVISKRDKEDYHEDLGGASGGTASASAAANCWSKDDDELPWCCICNSDATLRCYDCDNDLYCTTCFSEGHEQFGLFDHHYAPYEKAK